MSIKYKSARSAYLNFEFLNSKMLM